jgi:hypothetical protein
VGDLAGGHVDDVEQVWGAAVGCAPDQHKAREDGEQPSEAPPSAWGTNEASRSAWGGSKSGVAKAGHRGRL